MGSVVELQVKIVVDVIREWQPAVALLCVCVCVLVCVSAPVRACVRVC